MCNDTDAEPTSEPSSEPTCEPRKDHPGTDSSADPGTTTMRGLLRMDNPTWAQLVDRYFDRVYGWCREGGLDEHTAADVAQEVFISALGSLHRFERRSGASFGGWLRRICQRRIADYRRRQPEPAIGGTDAFEMFSQLASIRQSLAGESAVTPGDESDVPFGNESLDDERLLAAVASVQTEFETETWRAFWMVTVDGRTAVDTAFELGITRNAVYLSKSRVLKRLRSILGAN